MSHEDWIGYLDGELSPDAENRVEGEILRDSATLADFRALCRQRLLLALSHRAPVLEASVPRTPFLWRWQVAAATLLFAGTVAAVLALQGSRGAIPRVLHGSLLVAGASARSLPANTLAETPGDASAELALPNDSTLTLSPSSRIVARPAPSGERAPIELRRGSALLSAPPGDGELRIPYDLGIMTVRGTKFSVERVPGRNKGGMDMESLLALVVSALLGNVQAEVAGKIVVIPAGQIRVIGTDGAVAGSLPEFVALQDEKKDGEKEDGKEKKGKKKGDKKDKKDKKEKDDDDKDEKEGKDKKDKKDD